MKIVLIFSLLVKYIVSSLGKRHVPVFKQLKTPLLKNAFCHFGKNKPMEKENFKFVICFNCIFVFARTSKLLKLVLKFLHIYFAKQHMSKTKKKNYVKQWFLIGLEFPWIEYRMYAFKPLYWYLFGNKLKHCINQKMFTHRDVSSTYPKKSSANLLNFVPR